MSTKFSIHLDFEDVGDACFWEEQMHLTTMKESVFLKIKAVSEDIFIHENIRALIPHDNKRKVYVFSKVDTLLGPYVLRKALLPLYLKKGITIFEGFS